MGKARSRLSGPRGRLAGAGDRFQNQIPGVRSISQPQSQQIRAMLTLSLIAGLLLAVIALPAIGGIALIAKRAAVAFNDLPSELKPGQLAQRSQILAADGTPIADLAGAEDRVVVPLSQISLNVQRAVVAIEDSRFYEHNGIDIRGLIRSALKNADTGETTQGGSTLTQQYVKNVLLERADSKEEQKSATEKSLDRKLREARYALALEKVLSKNEILEGYLNIAYFGNGAYGVGAAAQHYFGTTAGRLNVAQAAMLAGLVKNPSAYDPTLHPKAAGDRRKTVIDRMLQLQLITPEVAAKANQQPLLPATHSTVRQLDACATSVAPFFCDYVRTQLLADKSFGATQVDRESRLFAGGLQVHSTLDLKVQKAAQDAVSSTINADNRVATVIVVVQPGTGNVLAIASNRKYGDAKQGPSYTKVNYATVDNAFQPGSTAKLFTLATAIEQGLSLHTRIKSPACYKSKVFDNPLENGARCPVGYVNAGDSEAGTFDLYSGTAHSVNTFYVQLEEKVGVSNVSHMAKMLGVRSAWADDPSSYIGSLTLGAKEVSPIDMATVYATIAAHGLRCEPKPISSISDAEDKPITFKGPGACTQVISPTVADTVTSVLQGVILGGTGTGANIGRPAAGKTGTTEKFAAAWFDGYVPQMAAAVWVGDPRGGQTHPLTNVTVPGRTYAFVYGGDLGATIWAKAMKAALVGYPVQSFPIPNYAGSIDLGVEVPDVNDLPYPEAIQQLEDAGFEVKVDPDRINAYPIAFGHVAATSPAAGTKVPSDTVITIFVSSGLPANPSFTPPPPTAGTPTPTPTPTDIQPSPTDVGPSPSPSPFP